MCIICIKKILQNKQCFVTKEKKSYKIKLYFVTKFYDRKKYIVTKNILKIKICYHFCNGFWFFVSEKIVTKYGIEL